MPKRGVRIFRAPTSSFRQRRASLVGPCVGAQCSAEVFPSRAVRSPSTGLGGGDSGNPGEGETVGGDIHIEVDQAVEKNRGDGGQTGDGEVAFVDRAGVERPACRPLNSLRRRSGRANPKTRVRRGLEGSRMRVVDGVHRSYGFIAQKAGLVRGPSRSRKAGML